MTQILDLKFPELKIIISDCNSRQELVGYIREIDLKMSRINADILENKIKIDSNNDAQKAEWYLAKKRYKNYLVMVKHFILNRIATVKENNVIVVNHIETKSFHKCFVSISKQILDSELFQEIVGKADIMRNKQLQGEEL